MNIKLKPFLIYLFILSLSLHSVSAAEASLTNLVEMIRPAVVTVIAYDKDMKPLRQGSGFFINAEGHLITNYHVFEGAYKAEIKTQDEVKFSIQSIVAENKAMDLIKVSADVPSGSVKWIEVEAKLPSIAEQIVVIGSPMGLDQTVSEGIISGIRDVPDVGMFLQMSAPISPGSSGGPVVNMEGLVVGIATFYLSSGQSLNFAVPSKYVLDLKQKIPAQSLSDWTNEKIALALKSIKQKLKELTPKYAQLFIETKPEKARIRILNIKPKFHQGMALKPGSYHVEVSADGYAMKKMWIKIEPGKGKNLKIALKRLPQMPTPNSSEPSLDPQSPATQGGLFDDIIMSTEEKKKAVEAWNKWQKARNRVYEKVQKIDKAPHVEPGKKAESWRRFLTIIAIDNPFSDEDDAMRVYARSRLAYWEEAKKIYRDKDAVNFELRPVNISGRFISNYEAGPLFVIEGDVKNESIRARGFIKITGKIYSENKRLEQKQSVFCGNILSDTELTRFNIEQIKERLSNPHCDKKVNQNISPGKSTPFMVVFWNLPDGFRDYVVEVDGSTLTPEVPAGYLERCLQEQYDASAEATLKNAFTAAQAWFSDYRRGVVTRNKMIKYGLRIPVGIELVIQSGKYETLAICTSHVKGKKIWFISWDGIITFKRK